MSTFVTLVNWKSTTTESFFNDWHHLILRSFSLSLSLCMKVLWSISQQCLSLRRISISSLYGADENDVFPSFPALLSYDGFRKGDTQFVNRIRSPVQLGRDQFSLPVTVPRLTLLIYAKCLNDYAFAPLLNARASSRLRAHVRFKRTEFTSIFVHQFLILCVLILQFSTDVVWYRVNKKKKVRNF